MNAADKLHTLVFNSLEQQIAVIDKAGIIIDVNRAWIEFGAENGLSLGYRWIGRKYLEALKASAASGDELAQVAAKGIMEVLNGVCPTFTMEYPCHSPEEKRWFMMSISQLGNNSRDLFVVSHLNITQRKLAEERVQHLATHDPLTGLANRRHFDDVLKTEIRRSARGRTPISLLALDLDYFKGYNDEHGHPKGDQCLVMIAAILRSAARRPTDVACRLGGDEFALLLVETDAEGSQIIAEAIIASVSGLGLTFGESGQVTASIGVISVLPDAKSSVGNLMLEADNALYLAKKAGRNRVERLEAANMSAITREAR